MWAYAIGIFMIMLSFSFMEPLQPNRLDADNMTILARNYIHYQNAASAYYNDNPGHTGEILETDMDLMPGYISIGDWQNQVETGVLYVWSEQGQRMVSPVVTQLKNTKRVGLNRSGQLISPLYGDLGVTLPAFIAEDSIVSISE